MSKILLIEPFFGGSHQQWAEGWKKYSQHQIEWLTLSGHHWKWRMHGGAVTLAQQFLRMDFCPDWIVASDMLDLSVFLALTRSKTAGIPIAVYFHENQLTYPWSATDQDPQKQQDNHYKFINYTSALVADKCLFNSDYHRKSFLEALPLFLKKFPDHKNLSSIDAVIRKSQVLPLGLDLRKHDANRPVQKSSTQSPMLLWNHRWEYDKNPDVFFNALFELQKQGIAFQLIVLGEQLQQSPLIFAKAKERLKKHILHWGYCQDRTKYSWWLWQADILPVTSHQDFFGGSIIEAVYCDTIPLLPKRLAYPEHFPEQSDFYYQNDEDFLESLIRAIHSFQANSPIKTRHLVQKYDWHSLIERYDELFTLRY